MNNFDQNQSLSNIMSVRCLKNVILCLNIVMFLVMLGCASSFGDSDKSFILSPSEQDQYVKKTPDVIIDELVKLIEKAGNDKLDFYTPKHYNRAKDYLIRAKELVDQNENINEVYRSIALAKIYIDKAYKVNKILQIELKDVYIAQKHLVEAKVSDLFPDEYKIILERIRKIAEVVEDGDAAKAFEDRSKLSVLSNDIRALEMRSVEIQVLGPSEEVFQQIKGEKLHELAPKSYEYARRVYNNSFTYIKSNLRNNKGLEKMATKALFAAKHALFVGKGIQKLKENLEKDLESIILNEEYMLYNLAKSLEYCDVRDRSIDDQAIQLTYVIKDLVRKINKRSGQTQGIDKDKNKKNAKENIECKPYVDIDIMSDFFGH